MKLIRVRDNYLNPFESLENELTHWFGNDFINEVSTSAAPAMDLSEDKDNVYATFDIPGFAQKDINLLLKDDVLTVSAKREEDKKESKEAGYYRTERYRGSFERRIALPVAIDGSKIEAIYSNGVLNVKLPKKEEAKPKEIKIDVK